MLNNIPRLLIAFIKYTLNGKTLPKKYRNLTTEVKKKVIQYAQQQALIPFLQYFEIFLTEDVKQLLFQSLVGYIYEDSKKEIEIKELLETFEKNKIFCMPLKGIVTRGYYPASELRTMGDLDILYKKEQTAELRKVMENLGFEYNGESSKHDHYRRNGLIVEMHKTLMPARSKAYNYFLKSWERAFPQNGKFYVHQMSMEDHYLYTLYHLIEHFLSGGIGIRMVLDIYILSRQLKIDWCYIRKELATLGIEEFSDHILHLANVWFADADYSNDDLELEEYIVNGGVYGREENLIRNTEILYKSRIHYLLYVIFPPYKVMQSVFPWLHIPLLLPVSWVIRFKRAWTNRKENVYLQFKLAFKMKTEETVDVQRQEDFLKRMGLF